MIAIRHARRQTESGNLSGNRKEPKTALARRERGDTSPLGGLASANAALAYANIFAASDLRPFRGLRAAVPFAYANLLIPQGRPTPFAFSATRGSIRLK